MPPLGRLLVPMLAGVVAFAACGGDDDAGGADGGGSLSADGEAGRAVFDSKNCASCHGTGLGPDLEGIFGTEVELEDGTTATVDEDYLERSITDPSAQKVDGFDVTMPPPDVSDDEVRLLVAYIRDLGGSPSGTVNTDGGTSP
jgi:mono/diheme cytochrome c family protein